MSMYGFTSEQALAAGWGTSIYRTPDGGVVEVSYVCSRPDGDEAFTDLVCVGEVSTYACKGRLGRDEAWNSVSTVFPQTALVDTLARLIRDNRLREVHGEDTIGVLMKCGAFHSDTWNENYVGSLANAVDAVLARLETNA